MRWTYRKTLEKILDTAGEKSFCSKEIGLTRSQLGILPHLMKDDLVQRISRRKCGGSRYSPSTWKITRSGIDMVERLRREEK